MTARFGATDRVVDPRVERLRVFGIFFLIVCALSAPGLMAGIMFWVGPPPYASESEYMVRNYGLPLAVAGFAVTVCMSFSAEVTIRQKLAAWFVCLAGIGAMLPVWLIWFLLGGLKF